MPSTGPTCNFLPKWCSLLDVDFALWSVAAHLDIVALHQLCAATKDLMPRGSPDAESDLWRAVANRSQTKFCFSGLDKATIKKLIYMVKDIPVVDSESFHVNNPEIARAIIQAISRAEGNSLSHMRDGGRYSMTFFSRFCFPPDQVQGWLSDPRRAISSSANTFPVGDTVLFMSLTVHNGEMSVFVEVDEQEDEEDEEFVPLLISIRGLSSSMIVRKEVVLVAEGRCIRAASLFSLGSPRIAAASFTEGLGCVVCVRDLVARAESDPSWRTVSSLNLEHLRHDSAP